MKEQSWDILYKLSDVDQKTNFFHEVLFEKVEDFFPKKTFRVSKEDQPWINQTIKILDRQRKREFFKHHKSKKWGNLNQKYLDQIKVAKTSYARKIVNDLKSPTLVSGILR